MGKGITNNIVRYDRESEGESQDAMVDAILYRPATRIIIASRLIFLKTRTFLVDRGR